MVDEGGAGRSMGDEGGAGGCMGDSRGAGGCMGDEGGAGGGSMGDGRGAGGGSMGDEGAAGLHGGHRCADCAANAPCAASRCIRALCICIAARVCDGRFRCRVHTILCGGNIQRQHQVEVNINQGTTYMRTYQELEVRELGIH
jgi:hypothetical protein